jgi:hypothetical protein
MATTNEVIVKLIVDGSGALRTLDQFDAKMNEASSSAVKAGSAVDAYTAQIQRMRAAQEASVPVLKAITTVRTQEERILQNVLGKADVVARARIAAERDIARAVASTSNLVIQGKMAEADAIAMLTTIEQAHVAQVNKVIAAQRNMADAVQSSSTSVRGSADAIQRYNLSASRNSFETANIAMQFQDIAVSAQMGMSPMMVALQQGTQLSAIMNQMRNPLQALPAAFMQIINPVSLLTIGFVGLAAAGAGWLFDAFKGAEDAKTALEQHDEWLDNILEGYKSIREAAKLAADEALRLPQEAVQSNLEANRVDAEAAYAAALQKTADAQADLNHQVALWTQHQADAARMFPDDKRRQEQFQSLIDMAGELNRLSVGTDSTKEEVDAFISRVTVLMNTAEDPALKNMASAMVTLGQELLQLNAIAASSKTALDFSRLGLQSFDDIRAGVADLVSEHRRLEAAARQAAAALEASRQAAILAAQGYGAGATAAAIYSSALRELGALIPAVAAAQRAQDSLNGAQKEYYRGLQALDSERRDGLADAEYQQRLETINTRYQEATDQVTGLAAAEDTLVRVTQQNSIDALTGREQAIARVKQQYAEQAKAIEESRSHGADHAKVDELLARNNEQLAAALSNTNAQFDAQAAKAGSRGASAALKQYERDLNSAIATADKAAEKLFPGEYARREAMELIALLDQYRDKLDSFQIAGLEKEIADLNTAADRGLRRLEDRAKEAGDEIQQTLGKVLSDLFSKPITDLDELLDRMLSGFSQIGQSNLSKLFEAKEGESSIFDAIFQGSKAGTKDGTKNGLQDILKSSGGIGGMASAGLGGLGIGYQTQNPLMGGIGGALSGFAAGGPVGAVIGGLAGVVGGLFGMNQALEEAKQKLREARVGIDQLMATMSGEKISAYAKAAADFEQQTIQAIALAEKAGDFELGARIQAAYDKAGQTLARELNREIERNINALRGQDYINEASDALELYNSRLRDQVALGQDVVGAQDELVLSLQKLVNDTALTGAQIDDLARRFPELADALSKISLETSKMTGRLLDAQYGFMIEARVEVDRARGDLQRAYEAEAGQLREIISAAQKAAQSLRQFRDSLKLDQNLSYLNPIDRMNEAQKQFQDVSARALAGDQEAIGQLEGVSRQYLEEARAYYATSESYFQIFDQVESILGQALSKAEQQVTEAQAQLNALDSLVSLHIDLNAGVMSVAQAIASLSAAVLNQKAREDEYYGGSGGYDRQITDLYRDVLGRAPDADGAAYYSAMLNSGMSMEELRRKFILNAQPELERGYPSYAVGTDFHPGGLAWVGEQGRELVNLPRGAQVIPHQQSVRMAAGNDNREVVAELRRVNARLESLERTTAGGAQAQVAATAQTTGALRDQTAELRVAAHKRRA